MFTFIHKQRINQIGSKAPPIIGLISYNVEVKQMYKISMTQSCDAAIFSSASSTASKRTEAAQIHTKEGKKTFPGISSFEDEEIRV